MQTTNLNNFEKSKEHYIQLVENKIKNNEIKRYKGIIFTVGFSKEPIILNILGFKLDYCFFIDTTETEKILDSIIKETNLKPSQFQKKTLRRDSAAEVYKAVKEGIEFLIEKGLKFEDITLDPTGGTKVMSVGCGMAVNTYNIDLIYVNTKKYDPDAKRPEAGSEEVINIQNPFKIYFDNLILKGLELLSIYRFGSARNCFKEVIEKASTPRSAEILKFISIGLHQWTLFNHENARINLERAKDLINNFRIFINIIKYLDEWIEILKELEKNEINAYKILDLYFNGERMYEREEYDNAAMRYYRAIEMWCQYYLKENYNLETQDPNYKNINMELLKNLKIKPTNIEMELLRLFNDVWRQIFIREGKEYEFKEETLLPYKIGLLNASVFLHIFNPNLIDFNLLFRIKDAAQVRNNSILAHGINSINERNLEKIRNICKELVMKLDGYNEFNNKIFNTERLKKIQEIIHKELLKL